MSWSEFIGVTTLLYALANPIGVIPILLGLTRKLKNINEARIIMLASVAVAGFLIVSIVFGEQILKFFNLALDDFRIAGGLLILFIAFEMFQAHYGGIMQTIEEKAEAEADLHGLAITPLAFPLLVGPAEMGILITLTSDMPDWTGKIFLLASALVTALLIAATLWMAMPINRLIGKTGINVATRIMALIVAAIGVKFILTGIKNQFPGLGA